MSFVPLSNVLILKSLIAVDVIERGSNVDTPDQCRKRMVLKILADIGIALHDRNIEGIQDSWVSDSRKHEDKGGVDCASG